MKKNMGGADRIIRLVIVIAVVVLYLTDIISGTLAIILGIVAVVFLLTSLLGFCPSYLPFGLSTRKTSGGPPPAQEPSPPPVQESPPPEELPHPEAGAEREAPPPSDPEGVQLP